MAISHGRSKPSPRQAPSSAAMISARFKEVKPLTIKNTAPAVPEAIGWCVLDRPGQQGLPLEIQSASRPGMGFCRSLQNHPAGVMSPPAPAC